MNFKSKRMKTLVEMDLSPFPLKRLFADSKLPKGQMKICESWEISYVFTRFAAFSINFAVASSISLHVKAQKSVPKQIFQTYFLLPTSNVCWCFVAIFLNGTMERNCFWLAVKRRDFWSADVILSRFILRSKEQRIFIAFRRCRILCVAKEQRNLLFPSSALFSKTLLPSRPFYNEHERWSSFLRAFLWKGQRKHQQETIWRIKIYALNESWRMKISLEWKVLSNT